MSCQKSFSVEVLLSILFASSTIWIKQQMITQQKQLIEYFHVLPNALELDEGIKLAEFGKLAA